MYLLLPSRTAMASIAQFSKNTIIKKIVATAALIPTGRVPVRKAD